MFSKHPGVLMAVLSAGALLVAGTAARANLLTNGNFASPAEALSHTFAAGSTGITGWTVDSTPTGGVQLMSESTHTGGQYPTNLNDGGQMVQLGSGVNQAVATTSGATYLITLDFAARQYAGYSTTATATLDFGGVSENLSAPSTTYVAESFRIVATGTSTTLDIYGADTTAAGLGDITDVSVTAVPEPASLGLLGIGALSLLLVGRKRKTA